MKRQIEAEIARKRRVSTPMRELYNESPFGTKIPPGKV